MDCNGYTKKYDAQSFNELRRMYSRIKGDIGSFEFDLSLTISKKITNDDLSQYLSSNMITNYNIKITVLDLHGEKLEDIGSITIVNSREREHHLLSWRNIPGFAQAKNNFDGYKCVCVHLMD